MRTVLMVGVVCAAFGLAACGDSGNQDGGNSCDANHPCPAGFTCVLSGGEGICVRITDGGTGDAPGADAGPAPDTSIVTHPDNITTNTTATFTFTSTPTGSTFECSLDGVAFAACTTPRMLTGLGDGTHTFQVRGVLNGGIDPTPASFTWRVDTAGPVVTGLQCPASSIGVSEVSIPFGSEAGATFACTLDGTTASCTSPAHYTRLSEAAHAFSVVATDTAGNHSTAATCSFTVTGTSPETTIDCPGAPVNTSDVSVSFSAVPAGATFECAIGTGAFAACTSPEALPGLADGTTKLLVRATAGAAVEPSPAECDIVVDTHAPTVTIVGGPSNGDATGTTVRFTYTADESNVTFRCTLDATSAACDASGITYTDLVPGTSHHFEVVAIDAASNTSAPATRDFTVGNGPTVIITLVPTKGPQDGAVVGPSGNILFTTLGGETGITFSACSLDGAPVAPCASPVPWANLTDGSTHEFDVTATNTTSSQSTMAKRSFTVDAAGPVVEVLSPSNGQISGTDVFVIFTATDPSTPVTTTCAVDGAPQACTAGAPFELLLTGGSRIFTITAEDAFGNKTVKTQQIEVDATGPNLTLTTQPGVSCPSSSDGGFDDAFRFSSDDPTPVTFTCQLDGLAVVDCTLSGNTGIKRWDDLSDGNHTMVITAFDAFGNPGPENTDRNGNVISTGVHITWLVDREPPTLTITVPPNNQSLETGVNGTIVFTAVDRPATSTHAVQILGCKIDGTLDCDDSHTVPVGNTYSNFGWHNLSDGAHTVNITAQDACGAVNAIPGGVTNTWTVDAVGDTIAFTPFTLTNVSPNAGPTGVTTSGTGQVNWTLHDLRSNPAGNTMPEPMPTPVTCAITPANTVTGSNTCVCAATNPLPGRAGEDWTCHATYTSATDTNATITLVYDDGAVPPNLSTPNPATLTWHIDATAPTIVFDTSPGVNGCTGAGALVVSKATGDVLFSSSDTLTPSTSPTASTVVCSLTDVPAVGVGVPVSVNCEALTATTYRYHFSGLTDGHHYRLTVVATDEVLNPRTSTRDWLVDASTPVVTFISPSSTAGFSNVISEPDGSGGGTTTATGTITTTDAFAATSAGTTNTCTIDRATVTCGLTSYNTATSLAEGNHTVVVTTSDCVGNTASPSLTFYVDKTPPSVHVTPNHDVEGVNSSETVTITAHDGGDNGTMTNIETITCALDGSPCPARVNQSGALPTVAGDPAYSAQLLLDELSAGRHVVTVRATDHFGHGTTQSGEFTIDLTDAQFEAFGHVILIGQDYASLGTPISGDATSDVEKILGNSVLASPAFGFARALNVLVASFGTVSGEVANVEAAICARIQQVQAAAGITCTCGGTPTCVSFSAGTFSPATATNVNDVSSFASALPGQDVVVLADLDVSTSLAGLDDNWASLVNSTANLGTVYVATSGRLTNATSAASPTFQLLAGNIAGLALNTDTPPWSLIAPCTFFDEPIQRTVSTDSQQLWPFSTGTLPANSVSFDFNDIAAFDIFFVNDEGGGTAVIDKWAPIGSGPSCPVITKN